MCVCVCVCVCARARAAGSVRACVSACVRVSECVCVHARRRELAHFLADAIQAITGSRPVRVDVWSRIYIYMTYRI